MKRLIAAAVILGSFAFSTVRGTSDEKKPLRSFEWDFSQKKTYVYSMELNDINSSLNAFGKDNTSESFINGDLVVKSSGDYTGSLGYENSNLTSYKLDSVGNVVDTTFIEDMPMSIDGMQTNGRFGNSGVDALWSSFLPLPSEDFKIGKTNQIPIKFPLNNYGKVTHIEGFNTLTFERMDTLCGYQCAVFTGAIDVTDINIPDDWKGTYDGSLTGTGTYYFDIINHHYVGSDVSIKMFGEMAPEEEEEVALFSTRMKFRIEEVLKLRLKAIID